MTQRVSMFLGAIALLALPTLADARAQGQGAMLPGFDPEAFGASLTAAQQRLIRMSDQIHARLIRTVSTMSLEQRRAYADALEAQLRQRRWRAPDR